MLFRARAEASLGPGGIGPRVEASSRFRDAERRARSKTKRLMIGFSQKDIAVETKRKAMTKWKELPCLLNGLAELLSESF